MKYDSLSYRLKESNRTGSVALIVGLLGLAASLVGFLVDEEQFFSSYLTAFLFWLSIGLGSLFFIMVHHMASATWSTVLRKLFEGFMGVLPLMVVLFLPIAFGLKHLYSWTDTELVAADHLLQGKSGFLNDAFFLLRAAVYLLVWAFLALRLRALSREQDQQHNSSVTARFRKVSAPGLILFAVTTTFAAWDWMMSLDPHWYSTIYGAYFFAGGAMAAMAFSLVVVLYLRAKGVLVNAITVEHHHDLAKLTFAFVVFWAYMAFSQYFLIWYANIPEETVWYLHRWEGSWKTVSLLIVFGHFCAPFLLLITRGAKRTPGLLLVVGFWLLFMHYVDLYWNIAPNFFHHGAHFSWIDLSTMVGVGGLFIWYFWKQFAGNPLVPVNDPGLKASLEFVNQ